LLVLLDVKAKEAQTKLKKYSSEDGKN